MNGVKRKEAPSRAANGFKKQKVDVSKPAKAKSKVIQKAEPKDENEDTFGGFSGDEDDDERDTTGGIAAKAGELTSKVKSRKPPVSDGEAKKFQLDTSSAEAHAKQRALVKERKASKPNADAIQRSKKIWERLRRKSHVPLEERKTLVAELFDIINSRMHDFIFKHDSVRVIQCGLKYANQEQRKSIAVELKGDIKELAESRYGKFLVGKMVTEGNEQVRDLIVPQFYGHVRRLINHPEASWIVDDIYRQVATSEQKATMLREWYGAEFALFNRNPSARVAAVATHDDTADLVKILERSPEKRKPILQYLLQMINSLIQKKLTGFTMLHDAMLQYILALLPGSAEHTEFLEILKGDIDAETEGGGGDLYRNLAFTKSGSRLVCLALSYGSAKDRKTILHVFKDAIEMMAHDQYAEIVLVVGLDVPDDTKMSAKSILFPLLGKNIESETERLDRLETIVTNLNARLPILFPMAGAAKWLIGEQHKAILEEVHEIRKTTSKKEPDARRKGVLEYLSDPLLELIAKRAESLAQSSFGCQFITETLLSSHNTEHKAQACSAVAGLASSDPTIAEHTSHKAAVGRMLKTLVLGGSFDPATKKIILAEPRLGFGAVLWPVIRQWLRVVEWACGDSSFVIVALLESEDVEEDVKEEVRTEIKKGRKKIQNAATEMEGKKGNAGAKILLEKIN